MVANDHGQIGESPGPVDEARRHPLPNGIRTILLTCEHEEQRDGHRAETDGYEQHGSSRLCASCRLLLWRVKRQSPS